jgi:succinate dehydrogenase flavin-adding protein (antitoxin of CptAB toxin-antitoxin module)
MIRRFFSSGIEVTRKQLLYHASKRGMLENELVLSGFAREHITSMDNRELSEFKTILDQVSFV